ncbi:hypothetical protein [Actinoplanes sp. NPDC051494]|uniref:hypothetical protein n=1 Tax=Actinoplanes sp. NPDC051494 TaxID=3363907 RepID=UPI0037B72020
MTIDHEDDILDQATSLLRQHTDAGWTAISGDILRRSLRAFRPSEPVRGRHDLGDFFVAADVLVARLRETVDAVPDAAAARITCTTGEDRRLAEVTIQIIAAYGTHLLSLAELVHAAAARRLTDELGTLAPADDAIHTHVHVGDVTDDPRDLY